VLATTDMTWCCKVNFKTNLPTQNLSKKYHAHTVSNVSIVKAITRQIVIYAYYRNTDSIIIGTTRN